MARDVCGEARSRHPDTCAWCANQNKAHLGVSAETEMLLVCHRCRLVAAVNQHMLLIISARTHSFKCVVSSHGVADCGWRLQSSVSVVS